MADFSSGSRVPNRLNVNPPLPLASVLPADGQEHPLVWFLACGVLLLGLFKLFPPRTVRLLVEAGNVDRIYGIGMLLAALLASVLLHELGHLTASLLLDFDILGGALGPWRISRRPSPAVSAIGRRWQVHFAGGAWLRASVSAIPKPGAAWRGKMLLVVAAGPLATLACCLAAGAALGAVHAQGPLASFLSSAAELNAVIFILGLIPNGRNARVHNDARLFLSLLSNSQAAEHILLYQLLMQMKRQGTRPCFYRQDIIQKIAHTPAHPEMAALFAQNISDWAYDRSDFVSAALWDQRAFEIGSQCDPRFACYPLTHSACFDLILRGRPKAARAKMTDLDTRLLQPEWLSERARAVQVLAAGDIGEALGALQRSEHALPGGLPSSDFELELIKRLRQAAKLLSEQEIALPRVP